MEALPNLLLGLFFLLIGSIFKVILDWDNLKPEAPRDRRATTIFRQLYLAPDLVMFSFGLLISTNGIQLLLAGKGVISPLGDNLGFWFSSLIAVHIGSLVFIILLWYLAGSRKYIPIEDIDNSYTGLDGTPCTERVPSVMWSTGIFTRAGFLTLVLGNALGFGCLLSYAWFLIRAF